MNVSRILPTRTLGRQGLEVSSLGPGRMGMSQSYGVPDDLESVELGVTTGVALQVDGGQIQSLV